jgi:hypothetical protein
MTLNPLVSYKGERSKSSTMYLSSKENKSETLGSPSWEGKCPSQDGENGDRNGVSFTFQCTSFLPPSGSMWLWRWGLGVGLHSVECSFPWTHQVAHPSAPKDTGMCDSHSCPRAYRQRCFQGPLQTEKSGCNDFDGCEGRGVSNEGTEFHPV